jgi:predicted dehydrogenase
MPGFGGWFGNKELAGGGPLIDLGVHRIDLALWLMGHPRPVSVSGSTYNVIAARQAIEQKKHYSVEDLAAGIVKFDNGATLLVEASWALNNNENEHMITSLYGEKGGLVQKNRNGTYDFTAEIYTEEGGNLYTKVLDQAVTQPPNGYHDFIDSVLQNREPLANADHGVRVQMILDGLYRSAAEGREIRFKK